jgi:hypothetical protein
MIACIQSFLEANFWQGLGVIFTALLTTLIICQSFRISRQQKQLQKDLHKKDEELQTRLAESNIAFQERLFDDNAKIALYKYRVDCYLTIIEAADLFFELNVKIPVILYQGKIPQPELLKNLSKIKSLLLRATHEARVLFSKEVYDCFKEHRNLAIRLYNLCFTILLDEQAMRKLGDDIQYQMNDILKNIEPDFAQILEILNNNSKIKAVIDSFPVVKDFFETGYKLHELFHSDKIDILVESYIDVKELGSRNMD